MDKWDFIQTWAALEAGAHIGKERLRLFYAEAGKRGVNVATQRLSGMQMYPETPMREIWENLVKPDNHNVHWLDGQPEPHLDGHHTSQPGMA